MKGQKQAKKVAKSLVKKLAKERDLVGSISLPVLGQISICSGSVPVSTKGLGNKKAIRSLMEASGKGLFPEEKCH